MTRKSLGKGIKALLEDFEIQNTSSVKEININLIKPNPNQPRKHFNEESLKELADSIKEKGILQPIIVREKDGYYEIIAGERRWRAAQSVGLMEIPAIIRNDITEKEQYEMSLIENIQRENLNPIELALSYNELITKYGLTHDDISKVIGKSRSSITNTLRLLKLPDEVKNMIAQGKLSEGHGRVLLALDNNDQIIKLAKECVEKNLSVRDLEDIIYFNKNVFEIKNVSRETQTKQLKEEKKNPDLQNVEEDITEALGTKVIISGSLDRGKIILYYYSRDDLERIYSKVVQDK